MIGYMNDAARWLVPKITKDIANNQSQKYVNGADDNIKCRRSPASGNIMRELDGAAYNPTEFIYLLSQSVDIRHKLYFAADNTTLLIVGRKVIRRGNIFSHVELEGVRVDR
ncbi:MAG: hypothetical protein UY48_C0017G0016 [Candidatus Gottesmanbacteria bacterium GW2011_GWB1_49_7]|uniref:Uncharacterized protein n=1 Tax=Candidatus Gottesmanbacteria bacterium GW2011_GWB1_49_7 TaxID=1618448 RepID=A0A0G1VYG5_9BACT|nr:MAG: hypothetical protein UY48_C0017G0016 [Candidatus Gottesmanbacteria bacterium GW2011_GWB1_49_7]